MSEGKFSYTKPAETKESRVMRLHIRIDEDALSIGELYGEATLTDELGAIVSTMILTQEQLQPMAHLKDTMLSDIGAVFVPELAQAEAIK